MYLSVILLKKRLLCSVLSPINKYKVNCFFLLEGPNIQFVVWTVPSTIFQQASDFPEIDHMD